MKKKTALFELYAVCIGALVHYLHYTKKTAFGARKKNGKKKQHYLQYIKKTALGTCSTGFARAFSANESYHSGTMTPLCWSMCMHIYIHIYKNKMFVP